MVKQIQKAKEHRIKQKLMSVAAGICLLSGQAAPVALAAQSASAGLMGTASPQDIQVLKKCLSKDTSTMSVAKNLLSKDFSLTEYEMLVISELIKQDIQKKAGNDEAMTSALKDLADLQNKYSNDYKTIFNHLPNEMKDAADKAADEALKKNQELAAPVQPHTVGNVGDASASNSGSYSPSFSSDDVKRIANTYGINYNPDAEKLEEMEAQGKTVQGAVQKAGSPSELADAMSLINIRRIPRNGLDKGEYEYTNPINPISDLNNEGIDLGTPDLESSIAAADSQDEKDSVQDLVDTMADIQDKKSKHFFLTMAHSIYYVDEKGEGNVPLDTSVTDDNGNYYQPSVTNQNQLEETLELGLGIRVHKALDLVLSVLAKNEDGNLSQDGTSWEFGNVLFKFHPERLDKGGLQKLNSQGIIIRDGGRVVGKRIGHNTSVVTDTENGTTTLQAGSLNMTYDKDEGVRFSNEDSRYYIGFGKMTLDFSTYTLQLSDCKAVQIGYHDNDQQLLVLYGKPTDARDGTIDEQGAKIKGQYDKDLFAAQYVTKKLLPNVTLTFNFAKGRDKGNINNPNGERKSEDTVYSLLVKGNHSKTSYEGEFAHINNKDLESNEAHSANADYLDITHQFSDKLNAQLHLINVDGNYDASSLVEDKTGDNLLTTNTGDGTPDYIYKPGQRGLDFTMNYTISDTAAMAFGYTRYSETEDKNSKTQFYLSGSKQWSLANKYGESRGDISLQQRFGYDSVSNRSYTNKSSDTTLSYSGSPWTDGQVSMDAQRVLDKEKGNETRFDLSVAHNFYPLDRVSVTPKVEYSLKKGTAGEEDSNAMDTTELINSLTIGYELIPDELTVNFLVSKEKYNIISSEIDEATGKKIDGERRNTMGVGLGFVWEPKRLLNGLTLGVSYRKDKVDYLDRNDNSNQDVWEYSAEYSRPISDKIRASLSYDYKSARDKAKPIYDDVTRTVSIDIDAQIGNHSSLNLQHSYESEYKPLDSAANHKTHTTTFQMVNRF